jgi:hypothetical protein
MAEVEQLLESFTVSNAAYHGGKFNGVCCQRLVANAKVISDGLQKILLSKKDESCENDTVHDKVSEAEVLLAIIDAAFAYLYIDHPTEDEKKKSRESIVVLMH